jgi:hypothetical protein
MEYIVLFLDSSPFDTANTSRSSVTGIEPNGFRRATKEW